MNTYSSQYKNRRATVMGRMLRLFLVTGPEKHQQRVKEWWHMNYKSFDDACAAGRCYVDNNKVIWPCDISRTACPSS